MDSLLPADLVGLAARVIAANAAIGRTVAVAESCTGGLVAAALTEIAGSSAVVDRGYVTYSNQAKEQDLGVAHRLLTAHGAVSGEVAAAMALGALGRAAAAQVAVAVTGIAGPGGGSLDKPVGLVYLAMACRGAGAPQVECHRFAGDRTAVRRATVRRALEILLG